ncbi:P-loop NTPase fold protein [Komagataeibacter xylinus]|uniref:P-loop NTPase fold protein n=1 Tax=Komagataeibacter xylinus TaxID=28448 RepID=UPI00280B8DFF|nr:P-loop NTPase fold protein [Komagataeibacter xylinus]
MTKIQKTNSSITASEKRRTTEQWAWTGPNYDLVRALDEYCYGEDVAPFALMLRGTWGCGKTWLVDRFFEEKKQNRSNDDASWFPLRVSLFGVTSATEIGDALYAELHPFLAGKPGQLGGFVVRSLLKTTLRIDLKELVGNGAAGKAGGSVTLAGADLSGLGPDGKPRRRIIVFDDIERARMPVTDVLAAIHPLVGSGENRVVLLANEEEFIDDDSPETEHYRRTKEKTVSLTLEVKADFQSTFTSLSKNIKNSDFRDFLEYLGERLAPLIIKAGSSNLRLLSFFVQLGEGLFREIKPAYRTESHYAALSELFMLVYIALVENRVHGIPFPIFVELVRKPRWFSADQRRRGEPHETEANEEHENIRKRLQSYDYAVLHSSLISMEDLESLVMRGTVQGKSINAALALDNRFTAETELPSWLRVWNYAQASEQEAVSAVAAFALDFNERKFIGLDMLHACSLYLTLHRIGEPSFDSHDPVSVVKSYIRDIFAKRILTEKDIQTAFDSRADPFFFAPFGRQFSEEGTPEFREVKEFYFSEKNLWRNRGLKIKSHELDELLPGNVNKLISLLFRVSEAPAVYEHTPILQHLDAITFSKKIINLPPDQRIYFLSCMKERFDRTVHSSGALHPEFTWFHELSEALKTTVKQSGGSPLFKEGLRVSVLYLCDNVAKIPLTQTPEV